MAKKMLIVGGLSLSVALMGLAIWQYGADPEGAATGASSKTVQLWQSMAQYEDNYLKAWRGAFDVNEPAPMEVLEAFNELAYAVTGPSGFWRKQVPQGWLGCSVNEEFEICQQLTEASREFKKWDRLQTQINELSDKRARRFLAKNQKKMLRYIETYVPSEMSSEAMKDTPFFEKHLSSAMNAGGGGQADMDDFDL